MSSGDLSSAVKLRNPPHRREKRSIYSRYLKPNIFSFKSKCESADVDSPVVHKSYVLNDKKMSGGHKSYADRVKELLSYDSTPSTSDKLNQQSRQRNYHFNPSPSVDVRQNKTKLNVQSDYRSRNSPPQPNVQKSYHFLNDDPNKVKEEPRVLHQKSHEKSDQVSRRLWTDLPSNDQYQQIIKHALSGADNVHEQSKHPYQSKSSVLPRKSPSIVNNNNNNSSARVIPIKIQMTER